MSKERLITERRSKEKQKPKGPRWSWFRLLQANYWCYSKVPKTMLTMTTVVAVDVKLRGNTREEKKRCLGVFMSQFNSLLLERKGKRERGGKKKKWKMQAKHYERSEREKKNREREKHRVLGLLVGLEAKKKRLEKWEREKGGWKKRSGMVKSYNGRSERVMLGWLHLRKKKNGILLFSLLLPSHDTVNGTEHTIFVFGLLAASHCVRRCNFASSSPITLSFPSMSIKKQNSRR